MARQTYKNFAEFFKQATGFEPYPYQVKLAESEKPFALNVPTGTGKTETAILGLWLWKRIRGIDNTPRRLIYCLPMRVLVEQTKGRVEEWIKNLGLEKEIGIELLIGGSEDKIQDIRPDKEYIIIGTQDMLVSGALNRAYATSPYMWPIVFGLLNNDCMWIMDEIQIMENALPTSIQLDAFRNKFDTYGSHKTVLMSATMNPDWLETVDSPKESLNIYNFGKTDENDVLKKRNNANKTLHKAPITLEKEDYVPSDVQEMLKLHRQGTVTVIMVNTVKRAQNLYKHLSKGRDNCKLIHSRFRSGERNKLNDWIKNMGESDDKIIVSTQVLEAGVDISACTIITELAPWSSLVQRFGRCNRYGNAQNANVYWVNITDDKIYRPYENKEIEVAREKLEEYTDKSVSPSDLPKINEMKMFDSVLRRRDLINLFDTSHDLSGSYVDISRFVRNTEQQMDIDIFWRDDADCGEKQLKPKKNEMCSVSKFSLKDFLKEKKNDGYGYVWDYKDKRWQRVYHNDLIVGQTIMLDSEIGGYSEICGWDATSEDKVSQIVVECDVNTESSDDPESISINPVPVTLQDHTKHVLEETDLFLKNIGFLDMDISNAIRMSAKYHDIGKAHNVFQGTMKRNITDDKYKERKEVWAKSQKIGRHKIPGFRHEVASALSYLKQKDQLNNNMRYLIAYIIMSHHGKVRMSLRSHSKNASQDKQQYLLGIKTNGDSLPCFSSDIVSAEEANFDMSMAHIGRSRSGEHSWTECILMLLDQYGPFRIAYLEALVRGADRLASKKEEGGKY